MGEVIIDTQLEPDWILGVVGSVSTREQGFIFLRDSENNQYFAHRGGFDPEWLFGRLEVGDSVSFRYRQTSKGRRAAHVREATVVEKVEIAEWEEQRGNR